MKKPVVRVLAWLAVSLLAAAAAAAEIQIDFEADLGTEIAQGRFDPQRDTLGLRGACPPLSWSQSLPMSALAAGRYGVRVAMDAQACGGQALQHKFRIQRPGQGGDAGWEPGLNHSVPLDAAGTRVALGEALRVARPFGAPAAPVPSRITGTVLRMQAVATQHVAPRPVWVWLPPGYDNEPERRYPVLYLHDGQNVFDASASGAEWQMDETAQRLVLAGAVQPFIVVAVPSGADRLHEFTPSAGMPAFARYLIEDLKPVVDARWRTQPGPQHTAVGGSSLGGLSSLWLVLHRRSHFGAALVVSPALWWDKRSVLRELQATPAAAGLAPARLWLDVGAHEGEGTVADVRQLRSTLLQRGWTDQTLATTEDPQGRHDEASWARRVGGMLQFLYAAPQPRPAAGSGTQDASATR